jgi:predicted Zn-dependent peptidase
MAHIRDEVFPEDELARSKRYLAGRLELRMEETRHLASWLGGQEALHEKVLTLDEALAELNAVTSEGIQKLAGRLIRDDGLRLSVVAPPRRGRRLESLLRLPGGAA